MIPPESQAEEGEEESNTDNNFLMVLDWSVKETTKTIDIGYFRDLNDIIFLTPDICIVTGFGDNIE
jgi:hypothetical protein